MLRTMRHLRTVCFAAAAAVVMFGAVARGQVDLGSGDGDVAPFQGVWNDPPEYEG